MDLYHSRLTQDDLNESIIKYKIPRDLHPQLPSEEFMMSELPYDAIGVYHCIFDFSGVRIPFSSFLLAIIKYYKIEPTVTLLRFSRPSASKVTGFLLPSVMLPIHDYMSWRHPSLAIDDPRPPTGSFNMDDVCWLSAHVVKLMDIPEGFLVLSGLIRVWKSQTCDSILRVMGIYDFLCLPEWTGDEDLAAGTLVPRLLPRLKLLRSERPLLLVLPRATFPSTQESDDDDDACVEIPLVSPIRSTVIILSLGNQGGGSAAPAAEGPSIQDSQGKDIMTDAAVASSGLLPFFAGPYYAAYLEGGVIGNYEFSREEWDAPHQPTLMILTNVVFKDPTVCKTVVDQFPTPQEMVQIKALTNDQMNAKMSVLHYLMMSHGGELLARYRGFLQSRHEQVTDLNDKLSSSDVAFAKSKVKGKERKKNIKSFTKSLDQLNAEVARLSTTLNQATVLKAEKDEEILRLKASPSDFVSFFQGQFQGLVWKFLLSDEFSRVQGELLSLAASAGFERGLSMHRTKEEFAVVMKEISQFVPGAQDRLAEASSLIAQTDYAFLNKIFEHAAEPLSVILQHPQL
ncbi:hypothetical protein Tco_0544855 [Tanacetum coccineum]